MDVTLIFRLAGLGILVAVTGQILSKSGKDEHALFVTLGGILVALFLLVGQIRDLFDYITTSFGL